MPTPPSPGPPAWREGLTDSQRGPVPRAIPNPAPAHLAGRMNKGRTMQADKYAKRLQFLGCTRWEPCGVIRETGQIALVDTHNPPECAYGSPAHRTTDALWRDYLEIQRTNQRELIRRNTKAN